MGDSALFLCKNIVHVLLNDKLHVNIVNILKYMHIIIVGKNLPALQGETDHWWGTALSSSAKTLYMYF